MANSFFAELKRRNVFKVATVYMVTAWLLVQIGDVILATFEAPAWVMKIVIVGLVFGFVVTLILAWALELTPDGVKVTTKEGQLKEAGKQVSNSRLNSSRLIFIAFVTGAIITGIVITYFNKGIDKADQANILLLEIDKLTKQKKYRQAYILAEQAELLLDDKNLLTPFWPKISDTLSVISTPPGAEVIAQFIEGQFDGKISLGKTPVINRRVARGEYFLNLDLEGYATAERIATGVLSRAELLQVQSSNINIEVQLEVLDNVPDGMATVPGGLYQLVSFDVPTGTKATIDDFFIDHYEVDNASYLKFILKNGYQKRGWWPEDIAINEKTVTFNSLQETLIDLTGLSGPRSWSGQRFPKGQEHYPVTGVSWYEASAYCSSLGKRLPSVFQWEKAARDGLYTHLEGVIMPWGYTPPTKSDIRRANFSSQGTIAVNAHPFGISPYGIYAMAGNVKEWTSNIYKHRYLFTGGSWSDPVYLFSAFGKMRPEQSADTLGFRCARVKANDRRRTRDQGSFALNFNTITPSYNPVSEQAFQNILSSYRYDKRPANAEIIETVETVDWTRIKLAYDATNNDRALAYLWLPKSTQAPHQTLLYVPSAGVFYYDDLSDRVESMLAPVIRSGRAVFSVVLKGMVGNRWGKGYTQPATDSIRFLDEMIQHANALSLGIDYLATRSDINLQKLGYIGVSFGAGSRLGFAATDPRYSAVIFIGGGIDERSKPTLPAADNINFAPYIKAPKLLINGRQDEEHPWLSRALPLWNLLQEPKELILLDGIGHIPSEKKLIAPINQFLDKTYGKP